MIHSMTGYAVVQQEAAGGTLAVELRSVNHRYLDLSFRAAEEFRAFEPAMRELLEKVAAGYDIAITPDGPRGPKYRLGAGLVYLAQKARIPVIPIHARFGRYLRLRTWDGFTIPLPFSRVEVTLDPELRFAETRDEAAFEAQREKMESVLRGDVE